MKISRNGQVSIPAEVRARWNTDRVAIVDVGGYLVVSPITEDPVGEIAGSYAGLLPTSDEMRRDARSETASRDR